MTPFPMCASVQFRDFHYHHKPLCVTYSPLTLLRGIPHGMTYSSLTLLRGIPHGMTYSSLTLLKGIPN